MTPEQQARLRELLLEGLAILTTPPSTLLPTRAELQAPQPAAQPSPQWPEATSPTTFPLAWGARVSPDFCAKVTWIGDTLGFLPGWLMACMAFETGRSFSSSVKNPASSATGLIQFMRQTAVDLGTTVEALSRMTPESQLNFVYKYFKARIKEHGPVRSLEDCYMAILWPAAMGKPVDHPLFINDIAKARDSYDVNKGLDTNKDGTVTKAEAAGRVRALYDEGMKPGNVR